MAAKKRLRQRITAVASACVLLAGMSMTTPAASVNTADKAPVVSTMAAEEGNTPAVSVADPVITKVTGGVSQAVLTWKPAAGAFEYRIFRSTSETAEGSKIATVQESGKTSYSYTDKKASAGKYYYRIKAVAVNPEDAQNPLVSEGANVQAVEVKLAAPTLTLTAKDYKTVTMSWQKVSGADGYQIKYNGKTIDKKSATSCSVSAVPSVAATYQVRAYKTVKDGTQKIYSSWSKKSITTQLKAPVIKSAKVKNGRSVAISWSAVDGASAYQLFVDGTHVATKTETSYTYISDKVLTWGKSHKIEVRAIRIVNGERKYGPKSTKAVKVTMKPAQPALSSATAKTYNSVQVKWKKVSGANGYELLRKADNGKYKKIARVKGEKTVSYLDKKASLGVKYTYTVRAYWQSTSKIQTSSYATKGVSAKTKLEAPVMRKATTGKEKITVKWKSADGAQGYIIYRQTEKGKFKKLATVKGASTLSYTDKKIKENVKYTYKVKAYRVSAGKTYSSALSQKGKSAKLATSVKVVTVHDANSIMNGKQVRLYYKPDGTQIQDVSSIIGKQSSYTIYVNKAKNQVTVYAKDGKVYIPVKSFVCSVGKSVTPTPNGTFNTKCKYRWQEMMGPSWGQWVTRITWDGILFHSVFYNSTNNNNSLSVAAYNNLGQAASHGCIRLTAGDAKWLYDNCAVGTKVVIHTKGGYEPLAKPTAYKLPSWHTWDPTDPNMQYKCRQKGCHHV